MTTFEPGEDWFYDTRTEKFFYGPPRSRPEDQDSPGPMDKLPPDWRSQLAQ